MVLYLHDTSREQMAQVRTKCLQHRYEYVRLRIEAEKGRIHQLLKI
jgi:hypothetical protein